VSNELGLIATETDHSSESFELFPVLELTDSRHLFCLDCATCATKREMMTGVHERSDDTKTNAQTLLLQSVCEGLKQAVPRRIGFAPHDRSRTSEDAIDWKRTSASKTKTKTPSALATQRAFTKIGSHFLQERAELYQSAIRG